MLSFELSNHVEAGQEEARSLVANLKAVQQTLRDAGTDINILRDLNVCVSKAQELFAESFLFIEKEAKNARKMADFLTNRAISEIVDGLVKQAHMYSRHNNLAVLVLRYYFDGPSGDANRKKLEDKLKVAVDAGSLGDYPWTCEFEDVLVKYRVKVEKLAVEYVVKDAKEMFEREAQVCFAVEDDGELGSLQDHDEVGIEKISLRRSV
ncbi:unnamed protein product [Aureobasidium vineae]|uniref:Uncharacterized protein n=1 Tax=Aureobasidium vineae TaxID=2773715 RepID=A0A9N8P7Z9_9PEZI|nr:unnamed protein product [Aureobasidium vineae]